MQTDLRTKETEYFIFVVCGQVCTDDLIHNALSFRKNQYPQEIC